MSDINISAIGYLNSLFNTTQNNIRLTTAIQKLISGPFPINPGSGNPLTVNKEFLDFLNEGKFTTIIGTRGEDRNPFDYVIPEGSPKKLFPYNAKDNLLNSLLNTCIQLFVKDVKFSSLTSNLDEYTQRLYKSSVNLEQTASAESVRKHFYDNYLFEYNNYASSPSKSMPRTIARTLLATIEVRINSWIAVKNRTLDPSNPSQTEKQTLIKIEQSYLSEYAGYDSSELNIGASTRAS